MAINEFNLASSEKQDEILSNFPVSGGTDWSTFVPLYLSSSIESGRHFTNFTNVAKVEGRGFITSVRVIVPLKYSSEKYSHGMYRVKVDGKIIIQGFVTAYTGSGTEYNEAGIFSPTNVSSMVGRRSRVDYGYIADESKLGVDNISHILYTEYPIWFDSKLEIEFKNNTHVTDKSGTSIISGGIM